MTAISAPKTKSTFRFRWENHQEKLLQSFRSLLKNGHLTDVTLAAGGKFLSAHRVILSAYSSYFEELLSLHEESQTIVVFQDVAFEELQMLVDFMYKGEMEIEYTKIASFFDTAQSLKIHALMQYQGPEETAPRMLPRIPKRRREAECPAQPAGRDSRQASGNNEGVVHLQQVPNRLPSVDKAVDLNRLSQSPVGAENEIEASDCAFEVEDLQGEGWDNEENSITIMKEEILVPCYELFHPEGVFNTDTASSESGDAQQSFKQEPQDAQDFNHGLNAFAHNSSSSARKLPKPAAKSRRKRTRLSRMRRLCSEKQFKALRRCNVSKTPPGVEAKDNNSDPDGEISSAAGQYEHIEAPELPSGGLANQTPGQGISKTSSRYRLRKRKSAVILPPASTGSATGTSRSESSTPEPAWASSSSARSTSRTARRVKTPNVVCQQCSKIYIGQYNLLRHQRLYCGREPAFACPTCGKRFYREDNLKNHDAIHKPVKFECPRCSKSYSLPSDLTDHERYECGKEPSFACRTCDKRFYHEDDLKNHHAVHKSAKFACPRCSRSYKFLSGLADHERYECGKEPTFACGTCDKRFYRACYLKKHRLVHDSTRLVCPRCPKSFNSQDDLAKHKRTYCGKEPSFACRTCDKRFYTEHRLKTHRLAVHQSVKFVCPRCPKSYSYRTDLLRHTRVSCGREPSFACGTCGKRFYREDHLKNHHAVAHELGDT